MMRVLITGARGWNSLHVAEVVMERLRARYGDDLLIVHGDCPTGVDAAFADVARRLKVTTEPHPARWDDLNAPGAVIKRRKDGTPYNAAAGPYRNRTMVEAGAAFCVAVRKDLSGPSGTRGTVELALRAGIAVWWVQSNDVEPVRVLGFRGPEVITAKAGRGGRQVSQDGSPRGDAGPATDGPQFLPDRLVGIGPNRVNSSRKCSGATSKIRSLM